MKITFFGAARQVTGSCYLLDTDAGKIMVDCGMFQGADHLRTQRRLDWPFEPRGVRALLLSHAHLDHCGLIPRLVALGFRGPIYATPATADLTAVILKDSAGIQEEDAEYDLRKWRKGGRVGPPPEPLYTQRDVTAALAKFRAVPYRKETNLGAGVTARFVDAGHIAGAASIEVRTTGPDALCVSFSGDIGYPARPILEDPVAPGRPEFLILESTYGDRVHEPLPQTQARFEEIVESTRQRGGALIIPTFAVGRAQELMWTFNKMQREGKLQGMPVYVDSPMAEEATEVLVRHPEVFDAELRDEIARGEHPFSFKGLRYVSTIAQSQALNEREGPFVVMAGSGMCTGGRIRHHLINHLGRPDDTVLFVGFQAGGTLGRRIQSGVKELRILGQDVTVRANVVALDGFSAHADRDQLLNWLAPLAGGLRRVILTHGEPQSLTALAAAIDARFKLPVLVPELGDTIDLTHEPAIAELAEERARDLQAEVGPGLV